MSTNKHGKFAGFLNGKGFYAALALCLVGAGAAAWVVVDRTLGSITDPTTASSGQSQSTVSQADSSWGYQKLEEAGGAASNVPISSAPSSAPSSSASTSVSSQAPVFEPSAPSEQLVLSPEQPTLAFVLPVHSAEVFNAYSAGELVKNTTLDKWCTHDGIDLRADQGAEVMAAADGVVQRVYQNGVWGQTVEILHGDTLLSIYMGLAPEVAVQEGETVIAEQVIGTVGNTNLAESKLDSHLHFALKEDGKFVDPLSTMGKL